jgi:hypothetical protein
MYVKEPLKWNGLSRLRIYYSLACLLRSDENPLVAVSEIPVDSGENKLVIATVHPLSDTEKEQMSAFLRMILTGKGSKTELLDIAIKRQLETLNDKLSSVYKHRAEDFYSKHPTPFTEILLKIHSPYHDLSVEDIRDFLLLLWENKKFVQDNDYMLEGAHGPVPSATHKLQKLFKLVEAVEYCTHLIEIGSKEKFDDLANSIEFHAANCHPELAIIKLASESRYCQYRIIRVGTSKRPCGFSQLFLMAMKKHDAHLGVELIPTSWRMVKDWKRFEGGFHKEFEWVWSFVLQKRYRGGQM